MKTIKLTKVEINHLLTLVEWNDKEGTYYGSKNQYVKRSGQIKTKLEDAIITNQKLQTNTDK